MGKEAVFILVNFHFSVRVLSWYFYHTFQSLWRTCFIMSRETLSPRYRTELIFLLYWIMFALLPSFKDQMTKIPRMKLFFQGRKDRREWTQTQIFWLQVHGVCHSAQCLVESYVEPFLCLCLWAWIWGKNCSIWVMTAGKKIKERVGVTSFLSLFLELISEKRKCLYLTTYYCPFAIIHNIHRLWTLKDWSLWFLQLWPWASRF